MSVIAATLANGGVCPTTDRRVFKAENVKYCLSLMYSCGMYDFSGEYAFTVGIPAKSGLSGALMLVVPGVCGIAIWSPRLDKHGNSVRGVRFSERLVETFAFHTYANMIDNNSLIDSTVTEVVRLSDASSYLCAAAAHRDLSELQRLIAGGADRFRLSECDTPFPVRLTAIPATRPGVAPCGGLLASATAGPMESVRQAGPARRQANSG